jgi:hypothetical protein
MRSILFVIVLLSGLIIALPAANLYKRQLSLPDNPSCQDCSQAIISNSSNDLHFLAVFGAKCGQYISDPDPDPDQLEVNCSFPDVPDGPPEVPDKLSLPDEPSCEQCKSQQAIVNAGNLMVIEEFQSKCNAFLPPLINPDGAPLVAVC